MNHYPSAGQGGDIVVSHHGGTPQVWDGRPKRMFARITGAAGGAGADYPWQQINETSSALPDYTLSGFAKSGTATVLPFRETNGRTDVPSGTKVRGDLSADGKCYLFQYGESGSSSTTWTGTVVTAVTCSGSTLTVTTKTLSITGRDLSVSLT